VFLLQLLQNLGQANSSGMEDIKREVLEKESIKLLLLVIVMQEGVHLS
jgi:hypothetical protein